MLNHLLASQLNVMSLFLRALLILLSAPLFLLPYGVEAAAENWNHSWEFRRGEHEPWSTCHLPHSEAAPYFLGASFRSGVVEYRKELVVPPEWQKQNIELEVEAAFQVATVYVDGHEVGTHRGGYTSFRMDMTPWASPGRHEVLIRVDNSWQPALAPRAGEHVFAAGLYRDVRLHVLPPVHLEHRGLVIRTPEVSHQRARVQLEARLHNNSPEPRRIRARARLEHPALSSEEYCLDLPPYAQRVLELELPPVPNPHLWSPDDPFLHTLFLEWECEGQSPQLESCPLGFRWCAWRAEKGFFLNGEHLFLLGVNVHQGQAGWGDGVTNASHERDVRMMKEAGFNFIRGSHYPHDPAFLAACDRLGMLYWSEGGIWGMGGASEGVSGWNAPAIPSEQKQQEAFLQSAAGQLREMVADARNHPSVIVWSVCNEPFFVPSRLLPDVRCMLCQLVDCVKSEDSARPVAIGGAQRGQIDHLGDVAGYNGDGARLFRNPGVANLVSEYGSVSEQRPGNGGFHWGDYGNERPAWRAGAAIWCGFDHGSIWESGQYMGLVDFFRLPKQSWYHYRQALRGIEPPPLPQAGKAVALALSCDKEALSSCKGEDDALICVQLLGKDGMPVDDALPIQLHISGPGEFPTGKSITFRPGSAIRLAAGAGAICFRSAWSGESTITATAPGLEPVSLRLYCHDADPALRYVPGQSRETPPRPYVEATSSQLPAIHSAANLALNRPCRSSSAAEGAQLATDGASSTAWQAAEADARPCLQLDLEFITPIRGVDCEGTPPQCLEASQDGRHWQPFVPDCRARYLRLFFLPAARVNELSVVSPPAADGRHPTSRQGREVGY